MFLDSDGVTIKRPDTRVKMDIRALFGRFSDAVIQVATCKVENIPKLLSILWDGKDATEFLDNGNREQGRVFALVTGSAATV